MSDKTFSWPNALKIGFHLSVAGGPQKIFDRYRERFCHSLQLFVGSPRVWKRTSFSSGFLKEFHQGREAAGNPPLIVHTGYLINLASANPVVRERSIALLRAEYQLAKTLQADFLVQHMGSCPDAEKGMKWMIANLNVALADIADCGPLLLLENTAGERNDLGGTVEQMAEVRAVLDFPSGVCLDTCHAFQAGYDLAKAPGRKALLQKLKVRLGLKTVRVIHLNDSLNPLAAHHDRHQHIDSGYIGGPALAAFLQDSQFHGCPVILETPQDPSGDPHLEHKNLEALRVAFAPKKTRGPVEPRAGKR